jgi:hypothetical protein
LPLEGNHLFHSELAAGAGQKEKRKWLDLNKKEFAGFFRETLFIFRAQY